MSPQELCRAERAKRPQLTFLSVLRQAEKASPPRKERLVYAHPKMSTRERAEHGQRIRDGRRKAHGA